MFSRVCPTHLRFLRIREKDGAPGDETHSFAKSANEWGTRQVPTSGMWGHTPPSRVRRQVREKCCGTSHVAKWPHFPPIQQDINGKNEGCLIFDLVNASLPVTSSIRQFCAKVTACGVANSADSCYVKQSVGERR
jgi:hypothetical protein